MDAVFTTLELAKRWKCHPNAVRAKEEEGVLHRLENLPGVKFSAKEVAQLEALGLDVEPFTAWERKKKDDEIAELKRLVEKYQRERLQMMSILQGV